MTSAAKKNNERVHALCESLGWFGRGKRSFRLFEQVSVRSLTSSGVGGLSSHLFEAQHKILIFVIY